MWIKDVHRSKVDQFQYFQMQIADPYILLRQQEQELRLCSVLRDLDNDTVVFDTTGAERTACVVI